MGRSGFGLWLVLVLLAGFAAEAADAKFNRKVNVGDDAPRWHELVGTDGRKHRLDDYQAADVVVVVFLCNHCPVAKKYQERFIKLVDDYRDKKIVLAAISCSKLPADRLEKMRERAQKEGYNFDYVSDPSQDIGRAYGASATPQVFVLDRSRKIAYMGAFDDNADPAKVKHHYARDAVDALLAGKTPEITETRPFGCEIEYDGE